MYHYINIIDNILVLFDLYTSMCIITGNITMYIVIYL